MKAALLIGVCVVGVSAGLLLGSRAPTSQALAGFERQPPSREVPDFHLQGTDGPFDRRRLLGHWTLLTFGYSHCPDVCPVTLATLNTVRSRLAGSGLDFEVRFVSVDPTRDTLAALAKYVGYFHCRGARGPLAEVRKLGDALGAGTSAVDDAGLISHSAGAFVIDPNANLAARIRPPLAVENIAAQLTRLRQGVVQGPSAAP